MKASPPTCWWVDSRDQLAACLSLPCRCTPAWMGRATSKVSARFPALFLSSRAARWWAVGVIIPDPPGAWHRVAGCRGGHGRPDSPPRAPACCPRGRRPVQACDSGVLRFTIGRRLVSSRATDFSRREVTSERDRSLLVRTRPVY